ncbi:hypothetical protein CNMCM6069_004953 [Aspergillus lentulus]|nr:hypothetical protein CNMCM6069_004953 [Aspergillus lentulus]
MFSHIVTAAKGLFARQEDDEDKLDSSNTTSTTSTSPIGREAKMVTATRRRNLETSPTTSGDNKGVSTSANGKRKPESTSAGKSESQHNKRRKRSSLEAAEEPERELPTESAMVESDSKREVAQAPASKTKHFRFDSEEPELPVGMETEAPEPQQKDPDNEDSSDDDEAPEAIDNSAQMSKIRLEAKKQERARQIEEQLRKEKRKQLDELRKQQAKQKEVTKLAAGSADDQLSESTETLRGSTTQDARRSALPALLPDEILNAAPVARPPTPPLEELNISHKKPNKLKFLDATEKRPKDVKLGDVTIRVLDENPTKKDKTTLPPKASKTGRNAKQNWLNRARSTATVNGLRRTAGGPSGMTSAAETTPLLPQYQQPASSNTSQQRGSRPPRTVTFNPLATVSTYHDATATVDPTYKPLSSGASSVSNAPSNQSRPTGLSALNSKLRRRNSHGAPYSTAVPSMPPAPKVGPQRTTKNAQKLKLLPDPVTAAEENVTDDDFPRDVYSQITRIKEPTARSHAARLGKADRDRLPRVTAYCTANSYRLEGVIKFLKARSKTRGANPKLYDECVYSPYDYLYEDKQRAPRNLSDNALGLHPISSSPDRPSGERRYSDSAVEVEDNAKSRREDLIDLRESQDQSHHDSHTESSVAVQRTDETPDFDTTIHTPEVFLFDYGTVVIWGMSPAQESRFLSDVSKFANSILSPEDTQVENFNFYYAREYQARIYNDFISLRDPRNHMIKLAISHALSQSVKTSLFEDLVSETISNTAPLPAQIAQTGSVNMTRRQINMQIGELFILRINIHLQGSVLDSPELMWAEPQLEPVYQAVRSYLEMDQRVSLLTERLDVIADLLAVLKDQLTHRHGEYLEWIVIILIAAEILVAAINIVVDLYAGVD